MVLYEFICPGNSSEVNGNIYSSEVPQSKLTHRLCQAGKSQGLHAGSQLCQPVRMFPCVDQGQASQHLLCTQAVWMEPLVGR